MCLAVAALLMAALVGVPDPGPTGLAAAVPDQVAWQAPDRVSPQRTEPSFAPVAGPASGGAAPRVARLRLGSFATPAPGLTVRDGGPSGAPLAPEAGSLRAAGGKNGTRKNGTRTIAVRQPVSAPFSAIGLTWAGDTGAMISVAVRYHVPEGNWSSWQTAGTSPADRDPDGPQGARRGGIDLVWVGSADGVEIQVTGRRRHAVIDLTVDLVDPLYLAADASPPPTTPEATPGHPRVAMPPIARRAEWGADERLMDWVPEYAGPVQAVTFHHTATTNSYQPADVPRILRAIYYYQAVGRGWGDIGYQVLVDRFGRLWEGRAGGLAQPVIGAHAGGFNRTTAGIAVIGDHRTVPIPAAAIESAARYTAWKLSLGPAVDPRGTVRLIGGGATSRYPSNTTVTVPRVFPHRQTTPTECPGDRGMDALPAIRERAYRLMGEWANPATMRSRLAMFNPAEGRWRLLGADGGFVGQPGDQPAAADYDGDGATDLATWSPSAGTWHLPGGSVPLGSTGDRPVPADYDGDGRAEPAVWRPTDGSWLFADGHGTQWGAPGDVPLPGDYDGNGRADLAVWRPTDGTWYVLGVGTYRLGESYHVPVPADYDGDGVIEPASWSPISQRWFVWGLPPVKFGEPGDVPVPGQYDGDGRADPAVWHPPASPGGTGGWNISQVGSFTFGQTGEVPLALS